MNDDDDDDKEEENSDIFNNNFVAMAIMLFIYICHRCHKITFFISNEVFATSTLVTTFLFNSNLFGESLISILFIQIKIQQRIAKWRLFITKGQFVVCPFIRSSCTLGYSHPASLFIHGINDIKKRCPFRCSTSVQTPSH